MKSLLMFAGLAMITLASFGQRKDNPKSPFKEVRGTSASGTPIYISYNAPSVRGRTIGKDLEPMAGKVWRTGADSATAFEVTKAVKINGKDLPAGRYALFTIANGDDWTILFNSDVHKWGAFSYKESADVLKVDVKAKKAASFAEQLAITASNKGEVHILWGDSDVSFTVK